MSLNENVNPSNDAVRDGPDVPLIDAAAAVGAAPDLALGNRIHAARARRASPSRRARTVASRSGTLARRASA